MNDSIVAKEWMQIVESVMSLFMIIDIENIRYVTYLFQVDVWAWLKMTLELKDIFRLTWTKFWELFDVKYKVVGITFVKFYKFLYLQ